MCFKPLKIFNAGEYIFNRLKLSGFNIAFIVDVLYHNKTIYYLHRHNFYTIGVVPITYNLNTVNFAIPTATESLFTQLFFVRFFIKVRKSTRTLRYKQFKSS